MDKDHLAKIVDEILIGNGFKKEESYWKLETEELIKIVNVQKSFFGNQYYINYGFDLKNLDYNADQMHVYRRLPMVNSNERNLLDWDEQIDERKRLTQIKLLLKKSLLTELNKINTASDLVENLGHQLHYEIPVKVKEFLEHVKHAVKFITILFTMDDCITLPELFSFCYIS